MKSRRFWLAALCVTFLTGLLVLTITSPSFETCEHDRKNHHAYEALRKESPLFVKAVVRLGLHAACARQTASENDGAITALSGIAVALFTLAFWVSADKLWRVVEGQARDMVRSIEAAGNAATAALRQAEVAERTLLVTNRPWMTLAEVRVASPMTYGPNGANFTFHYVAKNVGSSPAIFARTEAWIYVKTRSSPPPNVALRERCLPRRQGGTFDNFLSFAVAPNDLHIQSFSHSISYDEIRNTVESYRFNGKAVPVLFPIHVIGSITYKSAFSETWHETTFYFELSKLNDEGIVVGLSTLDTEIPAERLVISPNVLVPTEMT